MKSHLNTLLLIITILLLAFTGVAQSVRPIRDDVGYCWKMSDITKLIDYLEVNETGKKIDNIIAGILPHDDYLYAARIYYPLFRSIKSKEAVIFGVTHGTVRKEIGDPQNIILLDGYDEWKGPIKNIQISPLREFIKAHLDTSLFRVNNKAHELEHSIEGQLPFLQYYNPDIKITPIMVTAMTFEKMEEVSAKLAAIISEYVKEKNLIIAKDIVFLISSDANHYGKDFNNIPFGEDSAAHKKAIEQDIRIADNYLKGEIQPEKIKKFTEEMKNVVWCGKYSIPFGLLTTKKVVEIVQDKNIKGEIVRYSDTYTEGVLPVKGTELGTTAPFSLKHWCGFLSGVFYTDIK
ncbi:MAG: AmmeMemoRadiSam system protein B [Ignavibacteriales bacterium]|nr:AmmeMemoRadiSam system protein B [Ignavibacteriales bacterium]